MGFSIVTSRAGQRWSFDVLAQSGGLTYRSTWPGGDGDASFAANFPLDANPAGLMPGSRCAVYDGPVQVYAGVLGLPQRGSPWTVGVQGLASLADRYLPLDSDGNITSDTTVAVDLAIGRGLPWRRTADLPSAGELTDMPTSLTQLLNIAATKAAMRWTVNHRGAVAMDPDPLEPDLILIASAPPGGRSLDDYATDLWVKYAEMAAVMPESGGGPGLNVLLVPQLVAAPSNPPDSSVRPFGRWERIYDSTPAGAIGAAAAETLADKALALAKPDASFSGDITVAPGDLRTIGGQPVRLSTVRAGSRVRIIGTQPDPALGQLMFTTSVDLTIGTWTYDAVADLAALSPLGSNPRDLGSLLTAAAKVQKQNPRAAQMPR